MACAKVLSGIFSKDRKDPEKIIIIWRFKMDNKIVLIIIAILLPPLAVFLKNGVGKDLIINIILCFIFYIPGILHALWLITK